MKLSTMNSRDRRALTIGACIVIPGLMIPFVIKPYLNALTDIHAQTDDARQQLAREQHAIAQLPKLPSAQTRATEQLNAETPRLFQANDVLVASGDFAEYVASAAQSAGVRLSQSETRPVQPVSGGVQALGLEIRAEGDLNGLLHFINQLEAGGKLVRFETVSLSGGNKGPTAARGLPPEFAGLASMMQGAAENGDVAQFDPSANVLPGQAGGVPLPPNVATSVSVSPAGPNGLVQIPSSGNSQITLNENVQTGRNFSWQRGHQHQVRRSNPMDGVEVLSLSATLYGYRLNAAPWTLAETRGREAASPFTRTAIDFASLDDVLAHDLFSPTRTAPARSYRDALAEASMPAPVERQQTPPSMQAPPHLIGTGLGASSFAMAEIDKESPRFLHIGDNIGGYTLARVHSGSAEFTSPDGSSVRVVADAAGATSATANGNGYGNGYGRRHGRGGDGQGGSSWGPGGSSRRGQANPGNSSDQSGDNDLQQLQQLLGGNNIQVLGSSGNATSIIVGPPSN